MIDRYLREIQGEEPDGDWCAGILGKATAGQLAEGSDPAIRAIAKEAANLAAHVIGNPTRYTADERMQQRILREWRKVAALAAGLSRQ